MTKPFTYSIYCRPTGQYYYGVRFARGCDPDDMWKSYFTSSIYVKKLIQEHGKDAFDVKIRKVFKDPNEAKVWEAKFLSRIKASQREDFINKYDFMLFDLKNRCWINDGTQSKNIDSALLNDFLNSGWSKGRIFSQKHKKKLSSSKVGNSSCVGRVCSEETREKHRVSQLGKKHINKGKSKSIIIDGIKYHSFNDATNKTGISRYHLRKMFNEILLPS